MTFKSIPWWVKSCVSGLLIVGCCFAGGYLLHRVALIDNWLIAALLLCLLATLYLFVSAFPIQLLPSHTVGRRRPMQNAGIERIAFQFSRNPGDPQHHTTLSVDLIIAALPPALGALGIMVFLSL